MYCLLAIYLSFFTIIKGLFTLDTRTEFNAHSMHIGCVHTWIWFGAMRFECALNQNWIGTEFIVYSLNNNKITHSYILMNSSIIKAFVSRPPYTLYSLSKIQTMMVYHAGTLMTRCCWNETTYQVASCSSSKCMFHVVYYQWQGKANNWTDFSVRFDTSGMLAW